MMLGDGKGYDEPAKRFARPNDGAFGPWGPNTEGGDAGGWDAGDERSNSFNLAEYWRLALKHRFLILAVFVSAVVIGVVITLLTTPIYTASATVQIDREAARVLNVDDASPRESMIQGEEFFQTQYGLLRSRSLAERVIEARGLDTSDAFLDTMGVALPDAEPGGAAERAAKRRELVLQTVQDNLGVTPVRGSRLVTVSFNSPSPQLAAEVANAFVENFIQSNLDRKFDSSSYARQFLEDLITQTKAKLEDSERQLVAYATRQQIINVNDGDNNLSASQSLASNNLVALNGALAQARAGRVGAEEKWRQASAAPVMSLPDVYQNPAIQRMMESRATLEAQYQQNLTRYRPEFPEMLQLKAQIDELDRQISTMAGGIRDSIRSQYVVAANQERSLQTQVNGLKADVLDLRDRTIQYNILQREVDTSRTLYDGLLQRYKEVGVTGGVTTNNISIVDRADAPTIPSSPRLPSCLKFWTSPWPRRTMLRPSWACRSSVPFRCSPRANCRQRQSPIFARHFQRPIIPCAPPCSFQRLTGHRGACWSPVHARLKASPPPHTHWHKISPEAASACSWSTAICVIRRCTVWLASTTNVA